MNEDVIKRNESDNKINETDSKQSLIDLTKIEFSLSFCVISIRPMP